MKTSEFGPDAAPAMVADADARQRHLVEILEESTDFVATTDVVGQVLYANAAFRERFGIHTVDGIASESYNLFSFYTDASRERFMSDAVPQLWRHGRWSGEVEALSPEGAPIPMWQSAIAHLGPDGKPEYFSGISTDLSSIKSASEELRRSEERSRALLSQGSDVILVLTGAGLITYASPAIERILGYEVDALLGTVGFDLIHPDDLDGALNRFIQVIASNVSDGFQYRVRHADGSWRWVESFTSNHLDTPGVNGFILNARDITARHDANEELARAAALLSSVMRAAASEAIFVTDRDACIVAFSRGAESLLGYDAGEVVGLVHPRAFHLPEQISTLADELGLTADELFVHEPPKGQSLVREWTFVRKDGTMFDGSLIVSARFDEAGRLEGFLYLAADITERRRREAVLTDEVEHDQLTGLGNRKFLQRALGVAVSNDTWHSPGRALLFVDLDHFKQVNDTLGHAAGDAVLVEVAQRLTHTLRSGDIAVRLGGDEFVILLDSTPSVSIAMHIADRVVAAIAKEFVVGEHTISIGASVGVSISNIGRTAEELLSVADAAAYEAKRGGRGRVAAAAS